MTENIIGSRNSINTQPVTKFNKEQRMSWFIGMLQNPKITPAERSSWLDKQPLKKKEKVAFILEAQAKYAMSLLPKI